MNQPEWLSCENPQRMLRFLGRRFGTRKLRLFACACCRRIWEFLKDPRSRKAVETAEHFADGLVGGKARRMAESAALGATRQAEVAYWQSLEDEDWPKWRAAAAAAWAVAADGDWAEETAGEAADVRAGPWRSAAVLQAEKQAQCALLRDIFGNPFRPVSFDSDLVLAGDSAVGELARAIDEERRFQDLPLLADALAKMGCLDPDVLAHCRLGEEHVHGCWVLDGLLGKG